MEENLRWLWYAFGSAWIIHVVYVFWIASRVKEVRGQIDNLKELLRDQEQKVNQ
jgi:bacteriorhodopsin